MKNPYYLIWSDSISSIRKHHPKNRNWHIEIFILISGINAINLWIIYIWLKYFKIISLPLLDIKIFPGYVLNSVVSFFLMFSVPVLLINYLLIFHKNKYLKLLERYPVSKYRYGLIYGFTITLVALFSGILYSILT
jgi:hypothetical protein